MVVRPTALRPTKQAFGLGDPHVVDAGVALGHVAVGVEQPILFAVTAPPLPVGVVRFVDEAHRDAVLGERPQPLDQSIVEFSCPFAGEKCGDRLAAREEFVAVSPAAVVRVGVGNTRGIARVPCVLRRAHFLNGGLARERRNRRSLGHWRLLDGSANAGPAEGIVEETPLCPTQAERDSAARAGPPHSRSIVPGAAASPPSPSTVSPLLTP